MHNQPIFSLKETEAKELMEPLILLHERKFPVIHYRVRLQSGCGWYQQTPFLCH